MQDFTEVMNYLENMQINYEQIKGSFDIKVKDMIVQPNMKVKFDGSKSCLNIIMIK